jgi:hypothetical protein
MMKKKSFTLFALFMTGAVFMGYSAFHKAIEQDWRAVAWNVSFLLVNLYFANQWWPWKKSK